MHKFRLNFIRVLIFLADFIINHLVGFTAPQALVLSALLSIMFLPVIDKLIFKFAGDYVGYHG